MASLIVPAEPAPGGSWNTWIILEKPRLVIEEEGKTKGPVGQPEACGVG